MTIRSEVVKKSLFCITTSLIWSFQAIGAPNRSAGTPLPLPGNASKQAAVSQTFDVLEATPAAFESWILAESDILHRQQEKSEAGTTGNVDYKEFAPVHIEEAVFSRLRAGKYVTDRTVLVCVNAWQAFDLSKGEGAGRKTGPDFTDFEHVLDAIIPLLTDRKNLQAELFEERAQAYVASNDDVEAAKSYENELSMLDPMSREIDIRRTRAMIDLATSKASSGRTAAADDLFFKAMGYPILSHASLDNPEWRDVYLQAGESLIELRLKTHDLFGLKRLYIAAPFVDVLRPRLDKAIKELGG